MKKVNRYLSLIIGGIMAVGLFACSDEAKEKGVKAFQ